MLLSLLPVPAYAADDGRIALLAGLVTGYVTGISAIMTATR